MNRNFIPILGLYIVLASCATINPFPTDWDIETWEHIKSNVHNLNKQNKRQEAERFCLKVFAYVDSRVLEAMVEYAKLLEEIDPLKAETANQKAEAYRKFRDINESSTFLGFSTADQLNDYSDLLDKTGKNEEAIAIHYLAQVAFQDNVIHYLRLQMQEKGEDFRGVCIQGTFGSRTITE